MVDSTRPVTRRNDDAAGGAPPSFQVIRDETRLETAFGYQSVDGRFPYLLAVEPYFVLDSEQPRPAPSSGSNEVASYRQSWGIVVVARFAMRLDFSD